MIHFFFVLALLMCGCGYHLVNEEKIAISVPYVKGDREGGLTDAIVRALSHNSYFTYSSDGDWVLKAKIVGESNDRIGYRYDRNPMSGKLRTNVIGTENRKQISVEVSVVNATSGKLILGPQVVSASSDYDYVDQNSLQDLSFVDPVNGQIFPSIDFSLGQLDSVAAAGEDATIPIYRLLAQKIIEGLIVAGEDAD